MQATQRIREISADMKAQSDAFRESDNAFETAIAAGRLTRDITKPLYAGNFMYMGTNSEGHALFKNIITRAYIA